MKYLCFLTAVCSMLMSVLLWPLEAPAQTSTKTIRVGIIGLDTSHSTAFTEILNQADAAHDVAGFRMVAAYRLGSADIESSVGRIPRYTEAIKTMGVDIVGSIGELLARVDVVLLETNDGRPHLAQAMQVIAARKPLFIDKPVAAARRCSEDLRFEMIILSM